MPGLLTESEALSLLAEELEPVRGELGIGDDAAVFAVSGPAELVWTVDACLEHVHFERAWLTLADVAHKAIHSAVSDLAAMGARPERLLTQVTVSADVDAARFRSFARAEAEAARELGVSIVGGNLTWGADFGVVVTALGSLARGQRPLLQSGARAGDALWLAGEPGLAGVGYELLRAGAVDETASEHERRAMQAFRRPRALVAEGLRAALVGSGGLDVSDGLARDVRLFAEKSRVRMVLDEARLAALLPRALEHVCAERGWSCVERALTGGEDYLLLVSGAPGSAPPVGFHEVGRVEAGSGAFVRGPNGERALAGGFEHGA